MHLYTQSLQNRLLGSRETMRLRRYWKGAGRTGRFTAVSRLRSSNHPVEEHVEFVLPSALALLRSTLQPVRSMPTPGDKDLRAPRRSAPCAHGPRRADRRRIVGQTAIVDDLVAALLAGGHALLVGVPGLAKTLLVQTVAEALDLTFSRVQFTPDLMPSDITGTEVLEEDPATGKRVFQVRRRARSSRNVVLADEINRTPPKTQAALLQAMQEHAVTAAGQTHPLPEPFFVLATQNPIEQEGHVSAARGAARPVHARAADRLPDARGRGTHRDRRRRATRPRR